MTHRTAVAKLRHAQTGSYLLESLIAILIFAFGVLGLIGLLGNSLRVSNDARYRAEAANLARAMIAEMWTTKPAEMDARYGTLGSELEPWKTKAKDLLPAADENPPTVTLTDGLSTESRTAVVKVYWKLPGEDTVHQYVMTAQIGKNPS